MDNEVDCIRLLDVIVDTGSSHTIFSPDVLEEIGVVYENSITDMT